MNFTDTNSVKDSGISRDMVGSNIFSLFVETVLHPFSKTYQNIITLSAYPAGPLSSMTLPVKYYRLSEFDGGIGGVSGGSGSACNGLALNRNAGSGGAVGGNKYGNTYMCDYDLPILYAYLLSNGYIINTDMTKIMMKQNVDYGNYGNQGIVPRVGDAWGANVGWSGGSSSKKFLCMVSY